jgi:hypothetical protein
MKILAVEEADDDRVHSEMARHIPADNKLTPLADTMLGPEAGPQSWLVHAVRSCEQAGVLLGTAVSLYKALGIPNLTINGGSGSGTGRSVRPDVGPDCPRVTVGVFAGIMPRASAGFDRPPRRPLWEWCSADQSGGMARTICMRSAPQPASCTSTRSQQLPSRRSRGHPSQSDRPAVPVCTRPPWLCDKRHTEKARPLVGLALFLLKLAPQRCAPQNPPRTH